MEQPEEVQEENVTCAEDLLEEVDLEYLRFKMELIAKFDTAGLCKAFRYLANNPTDFVEWLDHKADILHRRLQEAHAERRENPCEETYDNEDSIIMYLDALTDIRAMWRDLLDQIAECFGDMSLRVAIEVLDQS